MARDKRAEPLAQPAGERHFAVAVFVVSGERVLLMLHKALRMWLPPGGHVEDSETPDEAAVRETYEETGVAIELVGERALALAYPRQLVRPEGVQVVRIDQAHEHIDLIYFARPAGGEVLPSVRADENEGERVGWYALSELAALGANDEIRLWAERAMCTVGKRLAE